MCGICGYISKKRITEEQLREMNDTMFHRGPNDSGVEIFESKNDYAIGFAQRRLSIQDLSPLGHQPMHSNDGRISIVFNGEIYNFLDLKKELSDYSYKSNCDTEVIIAAYLKWGIDMVDHIHGMFAIALLDREDDSVYLIRDRIGKKPLFYWLDGENIVFASELKPIFKCPGFNPTINRTIISRYLYQQYISAPDTVFENVYKLEAGMILKFNKGQISKRKYWDVKEVYKRLSADPVTDYQEAKAHLKGLLKESVADRMIADVPLGAFLSGGYDSSLITAIAQELSDKPVKTFCIGFDVKGYNEAEYAKEIAKHLGCDHTEYYISEKEMADLVDSIPQYYDEPFADDSQIPSMLVSAVAKKDVTVALSGDGGDEFFCGYNVYDKVMSARKLEALGGLAYGFGQIPVPGGRFLDKYPVKVRAIALNRNQDTKTQLASPTYVDAAYGLVYGEQGKRAYINSEFSNRAWEHTDKSVRYHVEKSMDISDYQIRRMILDMDTYLPEDILVKMDRASMKYSLENRCPIMDTRVMEYSFRLPHSFKYHDGDKKHILKDIVYDYIPREMLERPKTGFAAPVDKWLRGALKDQLLQYSDSSFIRNQGLFDETFVKNFIGNYLAQEDLGKGSGSNLSKLVWPFFVFQKWYDFYLK
ncbi:asparagine synthase (glutamine-hydrolyzing) [Butyrivibrio proteoclasticus]|uniref:asparagine synthase (glutamine-hydrolyzing) n=1 Tax=Butyrivibrio proteoclasticus TaxID=43305 RepID=UPI00047B70D5|nr:asparagine synthase (glutamine-hydrolyzing) [Butyrivibrio proteoclasticus]